MRNVIAALLLACASSNDRERPAPADPGSEATPAKVAVPEAPVPSPPPPAAPEPAAEPTQPPTTPAAAAEPALPPPPSASKKKAEVAPTPPSGPAPPPPPAPPAPPPTAPKPAASPKGDVAAGRAIWGRLCAKCHGDDGKGQTKMGQTLGAKDMTDPAWQAARSAAALRKVTREGNRAIKMPAFGPDKIDDKGLDDVVAFMRSLKR